MLEMRMLEMLTLEMLALEMPVLDTLLLDTLAPKLAKGCDPLSRVVASSRAFSSRCSSSR